MRYVWAKNKNWRNRSESSKDGEMAVSDDKMQWYGGMDTPGKPPSANQYIDLKYSPNFMKSFWTRNTMEPFIFVEIQFLSLKTRSHVPGRKIVSESFD